MMTKTKTRRWWTTKEVAFLRDNYDKMSYREIAAHLGRTVSSIEAMRIHLALPPLFSCRPWTQEEIELLITLHAQGWSYRKIAERLGRSRDAVRHKFYKEARAQVVAIRQSEVNEPECEVSCLIREGKKCVNVC